MTSSHSDAHADDTAIPVPKETAVVDRGRGSRLTVQGWQTLVLSIVGVLVLGGSVAGVLLFDRSDDVSRALIDEVQPSRSAAYRLQAAIRDQETAVRGYTIAADQQFLTPYFDGQAAEDVAADDIRRRAASRPELLADLAAIEQAADTWRSTFAEPLIASVTPGVPIVLNPAIAERGKVEFDRIRLLFDRQNEHLAAARATGIEDLNQIRTWRNVMLAAVAVILLITAALLAIAMRVAVTRPLAALAAACRRITEGNFDEKITPRGPKDVRGIAIDVENMRQRMVGELASARSARSRLAVQAEVLNERAVELRRSNAELEQFAYVASHDLQEPLRKVASFCQLIEKRYRDKLDDRGVEYIAFAVDGAKRMQVLINDLLTFSRAGRLNATSAQVSLEDALASALTNLDTLLESSGAEIVRQGRPLPQVLGDPTLLSMLWQNLLGNAMKFRRPEVNPRIVVDCGPTDDGTSWLISVSDNGIGIAPEFVEKVFVIFQRLHGREEYGGTGIGLALCKKIVEHHGGLIWIDTAYTEGTRFHLTLPVVQEAGPDTSDTSATNNRESTTTESGAHPPAVLEGVSE